MLLRQVNNLPRQRNRLAIVLTKAGGGYNSMGRTISEIRYEDVRRAIYLLAIGFIVLWTAYCLTDLIYVALTYWSLAPWLGILPMFTEPVVEPGFWGDYLKRLTASWGSVVTGAGVIALLLRHPVWTARSSEARERPEEPVATYPIIPEAERTEPRLLFIEEPRPPRHTPPEREREPLRREPDLRPAEPPSGEPAAAPAPSRRGTPVQPEPRLERAEGEEERRASPVRPAAFVRALRGRSGTGSQARRIEPGEQEEEEERGAERTPLFAGGAREEYGFFEVEYEDGTASVERLRRTDYGGDEAAGVALVRRRLADRAAADRRQPKPIVAITPVSYFGFPNRR